MKLNKQASKQFKTVALLPMKANSTRVPGKNFRNFSGKPLFWWILDTLLEVDEIDLIVINTDARSLLESHGCYDSSRILIRDRKTNICGDDVSMNLVIKDDIENVSAGTYLMTHTTNPLLTPETINHAIATFRDLRLNNGIDSLFSVSRVQSRFYTKDCKAINHDPGNLLPTQQLEPWFEENSNLYIFSSQSFHSTNARIGKSPGLFEISKTEAIDIDTPEDWLLAEAVAKSLDCMPQ